MAGIGVQDHRNHCSGSRNPRSRSRNRCSRWIGISVQDGPEYAPFVESYEPGHPDANVEGYVQYPNVNSMQEMANLASASRSYQANISAISVLKTMIQRTLELAR